MNDTNELGPPHFVEFLANQTTFTLDNLNSSMRYKFYLSAKTIKGSGPAITEEAVTVVNTCKLDGDGAFPDEPGAKIHERVLCMCPLKQA